VSAIGAMSPRSPWDEGDQVCGSAEDPDLDPKS